MSEKTNSVGVSVSLVPETDWNRCQGHDGNKTSARAIELPNAALMASDKADNISNENGEMDDVFLEKAMETENETIHYQVKILEEKLSAALLKLTAKDEMVKQHEKVSVEAVAGWEKAQSEVAVLKQQLEAAKDEKLEVEQRAAHLDEALRECVKQLGKAKEEQELKIQEAILQKTREWDSIRSDLESQILHLQAALESSKTESDDLGYKLDYLENENLALRHELDSQSEEMEVRTIERDLNAQAAETASKQHLESIKKLAKLETENRNLRSTIGKSSSIADHKSVSVSSLCVESLTDSHSESGEHMNAVEMNITKMGNNEYEPSCSDSWTSASFAELDNSKKQKAVNRNLPNSASEIDLMADFLEMEHLAALPANEPGTVSNQVVCEQSSPRAILEDLYQQMYKLKEQLQNTEEEKTQLHRLSEKTREENSVLEEKVQKLEKLNEEALEDQKRFEMLKKQLTDNGNTLEALQIELNKANDSKQLYEQQAVAYEVELKAMAAKVDALQDEVVAECARSKKLEAKCENLEDALLRQKHEVELELAVRLNAELKIKHEDLAVTALKLAECQQTIMSLGNQLQSLTTLEDFLGDGKHSKVTVGGSLIPGPGGDLWKMHSNGAFLAKREAELYNIPAKENIDNAVACSSPKPISKDLIDNVKGENGHANKIPNGVEDDPH